MITERHWTHAGRLGRRGAVAVAAAVALVVLLGFAGLALDFGVAFLAVQQCQTAADAAALGGTQYLPNTSLAQGVAQTVAGQNIRPDEANLFTVTTQTYAHGAALPGSGEAAPVGGALQVTAAKRVDYRFLPVLGFDGITVERSALSTKVLGGTCIAPMWIDDATPVSYGNVINLLMAEGPHTGIPGNFGFLTPNGGVDFVTALKGTITPEQEELQRLYVGDFVWAYTGLNIGQWRGALVTDSDSRLNRSLQSPWNSDTFESYRPDNPRIMIVPFVVYMEGTGNNARYRITRFAAFWLEDVIISGNNRYIAGRFIDFTKYGGTGSSIAITHLVG